MVNALTAMPGLAVRAAGLERFRVTIDHSRTGYQPNKRNTATKGMRSSRDLLLPKCCLCDAELTRTFVDLGMSPLCESYVDASQLDDAETFYPLHVGICESCMLVQIHAYLSGEDIFSDYAYFSSYSDSWVAQRPELCGDDDRSARANAGQHGHRGGQQ